MRPLQALLGAALVIVGAAAPHAMQGASTLSSASREVKTRPAPNSQIADVRNESSCNVSEPVKDRPPDDPHASSFASPNGIWYANEDRTLWAWWWGKRSVGDYKILWVRPVGARLKIAGHRLDGEAGPLTANMPAGDAGRRTFQPSAIAFPASGCWQVEATAGTTELKFVVRIP